jgi:ubiquinone/menaquinone biosynthesis C-methylase UbiE
MTLKNWLVYRIGDRALQEALQVLKTELPGALLDIGCGTKPYTRMTHGLVTRHVGVDHPASLHGNSAVDAATSAYQLPFQDSTFRSVLCSSVLEHLEEPEQAIREAYRVLEPGGRAFYATPFIWHIHEEPRDFYRYSCYGLEYLFSKAGFTEVEVRPLSGFWVTFGQLFVYQMYRAHRGPLHWLPVIPVAGILIQLLACALDTLDRSPGSRKWTWAYLTVARKPAA